MESKYKFFIVVFAAIVIVGLCFYSTGRINATTGKAVSTVDFTDSEKEELAKCLTEKGAEIYGAYWCGHCQNQKAIFGSAFDFINYIECDSAGENPQIDKCQTAGIQGYPTWKINGKLYSGEQSLERLKDLTEC